MSNALVILHIAINKPLRHCFDYLAPEGTDPSVLKPGIRVQVPFGNKQTLGILLKADHTPCIDPNKLKAATRLLDTEPLLTPSLLALYTWASSYYHHSIGEVILSTLPAQLKLEQPPRAKNPLAYTISAEGKNLDLTTFKNSPRQAALMALFRSSSGALTLPEIKARGFSAALLKNLLQKGWLETIQSTTLPYTVPVSSKFNTRQIEPPLPLSSHQQQALTQILSGSGFQSFLLEGVTGSGKTEVYLQAIANIIAQGKQALVLVPEIGLTPQTIARFERRFSQPIAALHSGLSDKERHDAWIKAKNGEVTIIIGTRSAIFIPLQSPGIIIIDEEHDTSFKQQSGFRYSARDLAIVRARHEAVPVVLGTATPALETLHNAKTGRFTWLKLPERAGNSLQPSFRTIDLRSQYLEEGLSPQLLQAMRQHLSQNHQVLLFLNRRGFAPVLLCHNCGWTAQCRRCDARLTLHQSPQRLICHHCTAIYTLPDRCGQCHNPQLFGIGLGTERLEQALNRHFPTTKVLRIDRDTIRNKDHLNQALANIHQESGQILLGTQMLAKGHHFPNVTLVGIIDVDSGLYSTDFRASERMGQIILQVAGRAGRENKPGQVLLQTHHPDHVLVQTLIKQDFGAFADLLLQERSSAAWPPFSYLALIRAEAKQKQAPLHFLKEICNLVEQPGTAPVKLSGPIPAPMERKAGSYRALLLLQAANRQTLQRWLEFYMPQIERLKPKSRVRWSLDVDPLELF